MSEVVGIIGDGQLGRMLVEAGHELDPEMQFLVLGSGEQSPASLVGAEQLTYENALFSGEGMMELAVRSDHVTWEVEHIDSGTLETISGIKGNINPDPTTLTNIRDKLVQKKLFADAGIPVATFREMDVFSLGNLHFETETKPAVHPYMLKLRAGGFDGRGNARIEEGASFDDAKKAFNKLVEGDTQKGGVYMERMVDLEDEFSGELSVIAARGQQDSDLVLYEPVDSYHENSICLKTVAPSQHSPELRREAAELAHDTMRVLKGFGVFAIEMFVTAKGELLVNEVAPRVHNSGHHTIHSAQTSQFEQHLRAISGRELGSAKLKVPHAVMVNILGRTESSDIDWTTPEAPEGIHVVHYQKSPRPERKIGHITAVALEGESVTETVQRAEEFRETIEV